MTDDHRSAIENTINRYSVLYDTGEFDALVDVFAEDAVFDVEPDPGFFPLPVTGRDEIVASLRARRAEVIESAVRRHVVTNTIVDECDGETARTRSFLSVISVPHGGPPQLHLTGVYHDAFRHEDGAWRFTERKLRMDGPPRDAAEASTTPAAGSVGGSELEREIVGEIGEALPGAVSRYTELDPDLFRAYRAFRSAILDTGQLPRHIKLLMAISILTATKQGDAMDMYASIARKEGASAEELREALRVGVLFSGGPGIAAAAETAVRHGSE